MTEEHMASRTIVKSPPELWAECSVAQSLARHLGEFGEIKITRLEPETTVAWEGEHASGTVRLEPSGWGTQVTLTATPVVVELPEPPLEPEPEPEPVAVEPEPEATEETEIVQDFEEPHDADESDDDEEEEPSDHLPRWQVFARLWSRLGRKSHDSDDDDDEEEASEDEDETPEAVEEAPEPVDEGAEPEFVSGMEEEPEAVDDSPVSVPGLNHQALLVGALDSLGQAHHRPFSRA